MIFVKEMTVLKRVCDRKEEQVENIATFFFFLTSLRRWDDQRWWWRYMRKLFLLIIYITWCAVFHVGCGTRFTWRTAQCLHDNLYSTKDYLTIPLLPLTFNGCRQLAWCFADVSYWYNILSLKFVEISNEGKELHPELKNWVVMFSEREGWWHLSLSQTPHLARKRKGAPSQTPQYSPLWSQGQADAVV